MSNYVLGLDFFIALSDNGPSVTSENSQRLDRDYRFHRNYRHLGDLNLLERLRKLTMP